MKIDQLLSFPEFPEMLETALPIFMKELNLDKLPKIKLRKQIVDNQQPTFGRFVDDEQTIYLSINNRNPNDILRTLAHEMVHYKQSIDGRIDHTSGETGSPIENEANAMAGVMMRNLNKAHPKFLLCPPIIIQ